MQEWIISFVAAHEYLIYVALVIICLVEGPILTVLCGMLIHLGVFPLVPVYLALMFGDLLGDVMWYWIGRLLGFRFIARFGKFFSVEKKEVAVVSKVFHTYHASILTISKVTMGLGFAVVTLFTAGLVRIPFKKYIFINGLGQIFWTGLLLFIGYTFGQLFDQIDGIIGKVSVIAMAVMFVFVFVGFGKYVKRRLTAV